MTRTRGVLCAIGVLVFFVLSIEAKGPVRIGFLGPPEEPRFSELRQGLIEGLREQGFPEASYEIMEARVPRGDPAGVQAAVTTFLRQRVQVLFAIGSTMAKPARQVSPDVPMVYLTPGDPVKHGLVQSLAHPGGNTTAMTFEHPELAGKRLELLKEVLPTLRRVLILFDPRDGSPRRGAKAARQAASQLGLTLVERETRRPEDIARGLEALGEVDALLAIPGGLPTGYYRDMIRAANASRVPTLFHARTGTTTDAFMTHGTSDEDIARQMARQVAKILRGTKAGDIPVERPRDVEMTVNLKTAKALGLTIPPLFLYQADKVIR
jgi:putative ABC transport system substrate-binding protein